MAKQGGLGDNVYIDGVDISGDVGSLGAIGGGNSPLVVTGVNKSGPERIGGLRDGRIEFVSYFNDAAAAEHGVLKTLPTADRTVSYYRGTALGGQVASMNAKQIGYDPTRGEDGSLTFAVAAQANAFGLEWGEQLTTGIDLFAAAGAGAGLDYGAAIGTTAFGLQAFLHTFAVGSGTAVVAVQHSNDNGVDPWTDVTGAVFVTNTVAGQRLQTARNASVKRWLRLNATGVFTNISMALSVTRNLVDTTF